MVVVLPLAVVAGGAQVHEVGLGRRRHLLVGDGDSDDAARRLERVTLVGVLLLLLDGGGDPCHDGAASEVLEV